MLKYGNDCPAEEFVNWKSVNHKVEGSNVWSADDFILERISNKPPIHKFVGKTRIYRRYSMTQDVPITERSRFDAYRKPEGLHDPTNCSWIFPNIAAVYVYKSSFIYEFHFKCVSMKSNHFSSWGVSTKVISKTWNRNGRRVFIKLRPASKVNSQQFIPYKESGSEILLGTHWTPRRSRLIPTVRNWEKQNQSYFFIRFNSIAGFCLLIIWMDSQFSFS